MTEVLATILSDPALAAAAPILRAGKSSMNNRVAWVHTSEVLDIGHLLRGGELLLVGGVGLQAASRDQRVAYVRTLVSASASGLAIETGTALPSIPVEMLEVAERLRFPLIEFTKTVPFVEVTQTINSRLVSASIRRSQIADGIARDLISLLVSGTQLPDLLASVASLVGGTAELRTTQGHLLVEAGTATGEEVRATCSAPIMTGDITTAILHLSHPEGVDPLVIDGVLSSVPDTLGMALRQWRQPSDFERTCHRFFAALSSDGSGREIAELARRLRIDRHVAWLAVVADIGPGVSASFIIRMLSKVRRIAVSDIAGGRLWSVVALADWPDQTPMQMRGALIDELRSDAPTGTHICVGPLVTDLMELSASLTAAQETVAISRLEGDGNVLDALGYGIKRHIAKINSPVLVDAFIKEQIGSILDYDKERDQDVLFPTLMVYLKQLGNKTETSQAMHIHRQSLYQRLDRISGLLGDIPIGDDRWGPIFLAVHLEDTRRRGLPGT